MSPFHATPLHFILKRMPEATLISAGWFLLERIKPRTLIKSSHLSVLVLASPTMAHQPYFFQKWNIPGYKLKSVMYIYEFLLLCPPLSVTIKSRI